MIIIYMLKSVGKLFCLSNTCIYLILCLIILINTIILSIERYLCKEDEEVCDNTHTRNWFIVSVIGTICLVCVLFLQNIHTIIKTKKYKLHTMTVLLSIYLLIVSFDKFINYDDIANPPEYAYKHPQSEEYANNIVKRKNIVMSIYRTFNIATFSILSLILLKILCKC